MQVKEIIALNSLLEPSLNILERSSRAMDLAKVKPVTLCFISIREMTRLLFCLYVDDIILTSNDETGMSIVKKNWRMISKSKTWDPQSTS